jgi:hypothetical protein
MGMYVREYLTLPEPVGAKNVRFLPIASPDSPTTFTCSCPVTPMECTFNVTVAPGTALALPFVTWLGWGEDDFLPDECWGGTCEGPPPINLREIFADVTLDEQPIAEPSAAYYVGPTPIEPPIPCPLGGPDNYCVLYQAIGAVIKPLTPGSHTIYLQSGFRGEDPPPAGPWELVYRNQWNITVLPPGRSK